MRTGQATEVNDGCHWGVHRREEQALIVFGKTDEVNLARYGTFNT